MIEIGYHWHGPDSLYIEDRDKPAPKSIKTIDDFIDDHIFFLSFRRKDWYPEHLGIEGELLTIKFNCNKIYFTTSWREYFESFEEDDNLVLYRLSEYGKQLSFQNYDLIVRADDHNELSEGFLINPKKQIISLSSEKC